MRMAVLTRIEVTHWAGLLLGAYTLCVAPLSNAAASDATNPQVTPLMQINLPAIQVTAQPPGASPETILKRQLAQIASVAQLTSVSGTPIVVTGEGTVTVAPDLAQVRGGVTTRAASVREAADTNSRNMTAIINKLVDAGINRKDIQTSQFSIQPVYSGQPSYDSSHTTQKPLGYNVSNQVVVKIRTIEKVADILDLMIAAGANNVWDLEFLVSDPSKALDEARRSAIADARHKAELYANAAGVALGPVVSVNEQGTVAPGPIRMRAAVAADRAPPIEAGEDTLRVSVSVGFAIGR
jgi:uncharacterized protein